MATSFKRITVVTALIATALVSAAADAQRPYRGGRGLPPPPGTGRLRNAAQGMCLDVAGWAAAGDADVLLWACNDDPDQVWSFTPSGELRNALNGTCLDVAGTRGEQGANVDVLGCESLDDQRWTLVGRGNGTFELRNGKRGLCLDVNGRAGARGGDVMLWACDGGADQLWSFEAYAPATRPVYQPLPPSGPRPRAYASQPPRPMEEDPFRALVAAVRNASFSDSQLTVIQQAATGNYFRVGQIKSLIDLVAFSATKLRVLELGAQRIVDPENAFTIYDAFAFSADKAQAKQILRRSGL
jgi:ricin-type beta-trefoil lectin protein/uncharacterized protein DUF4476